jgi:hypothetical protein
MTVSTGPKPFVFVLMPFAAEFRDIYDFGIKGAAEDVGAYAARVDEQDFAGSVLDRIVNQISKADAIVADVSGRNSNVFYEVGYAHALDKIVVLLAKDEADIPFDLRLHQHIIYGGRIGDLRPALAKRLAWALGESARRGQPGSSQMKLSVHLFGYEINLAGLPQVSKRWTNATVAPYVWEFEIRNDSLDSIPAITHVYLLTEEDTPMEPSGKSAESPADYSRLFTSSTGKRVLPDASVPPDPAAPAEASYLAKLTRAYRISATLPAMPPGAIEQFLFDVNVMRDDCTARFCLRFNTTSGIQDFPFDLEFRPDSPPEKHTAQRSNPAKKKSRRPAVRKRLLA